MKAVGQERWFNAGSIGQLPSPLIHRAVVTADQMRQIEARIFAAGMPVAALMEKVAGLIAQWIRAHFPQSTFPQIGVLAGPGHNGGDALVVARELHLNGYRVQVHAPFSRLKELTEQHARYAASLGIPFVENVAALQDCNALVDGLFGFGLERDIEGDLAETVATLNAWPQPKISIDLPSGLQTDTGAVLSTALCATHTLCLGLWKRAFFQDEALPYLGEVELIDFGIPTADIEAVLGQSPVVQRLTSEAAIARLPLPRPPATHKYRVGHLLLVAGSRQYGGAAFLAGLGARASGMGMVTLAVPESLRGPFHAQLPEALILGCPETETGAIAHLPDSLDLDKFNAIACGPGLSRQAHTAVDQVLASGAPLLLDADGLNLLADQGAAATLSKRTAPTLLTPHPGEFKRLFPEIAKQQLEAGSAALAAAQASGAVLILKGGRSAIASPQGQLWYLAASTPALARGGSGDVLTGLAAGLLAQSAQNPDQATEGALNAALSAAWWHAQAARAAAKERSVLGVDPLTLTQFLDPTLAQWLQN
ncbi:NAD(P)H-hydrate dehydratase [Pseudanabaena sp. FACHB-2040]|uniref:NAD(P)H-hydrate dehydratase n=1 Tax=Pseudanabaena sp. FACHB-2040 TaxID=2692859 RepID=UPI0016870977|nr:NAD(P)H-hydrate dehydratase [Pseudanabaena sp. FACHB-2040]MBD2258682.1 NAD(P)H-hydrate dehydratase [Pseudanabaena sp. FACHB-2040]